ncbi:MAG TPA: 5-(carboxyamino)imidazole ribonucleotide synthase [Gemmatimonadales bacterium]|nr:5-(carboxyamino)imidazole ribonucleotide synthase [Gemmatimonadales bacterium]
MIPPGSTIGLLGGGQLGRMFASEAVRMGYQVIVVDPDPDAPAAQLALRHIHADWTDSAIIDDLAANVSVVTTEFENVPADLLRALAAHVPVRPGADAVAVCQDRVAEKRFLRRTGISTVRWGAIAAEADIDDAWQDAGSGPVIVKTNSLGYDGKGQALADDPGSIARAWRSLGEVRCIVEERVSLAREISVMVARGTDGQMATWDIGENVHVGGILHTTMVPAEVDAGVGETARNAALQIAERLDYVGVMGVECFVTTDGEVLVNELAPRPHNSGHWTIDASMTSQFEQQVRAITGLPLGRTDRLSPAAMVNILGDAWRGAPPRFDRAISRPGVRLHLYGKREPRPGRKMGHLTALATDSASALRLVLEALDSLSG